MISISTVFNVRKHKSWAGVMDELLSIGFRSIELNLEIPDKWFPDIIKSVSSSKIIVSGLHNICPAIDPLPQGKSYYDVYFLTSDDDTERKTGIELTKRTIQHAADVGGKYIVVHAGEVPIDLSGKTVNSYAFNFGINGMLYEKYRQECIKQRKEKRDIYLDKLSSSLEEILPVAQQYNIMIGLENRFYYHEIPIPEDLEILFTRFNDTPLRYWHDVGHAEINTRLKFFGSHADFLGPFKHKLLGMHLHDVRGMHDHFAPGTGEIDFNIFKPYMTEKINYVVEPLPKNSVSDLKKSLKYLNEIIPL
jgi:sugar phosphate isomerase/epimerase